jgi:hypothetical protein
MGLAIIYLAYLLTTVIVHGEEMIAIIVTYCEHTDPALVNSFTNSTWIEEELTKSSQTVKRSFTVRVFEITD